MADAPGGTLDARTVAMHTLLLDSIAARAIDALEARGIGVILLKGRVTADWLYHDVVRPYGDVDLLVDPSRMTAVIETLGELGYHHWMAGADPIEYGSNEIELIGPGQICIDLHHTLLGITDDPVASWGVLSANTDRMTVGRRSVRVLRPAARAMHLALHVAQNGPADRKPVCDLERGLDQLPISLWQEAQQIAEAVGASEAFSSGLRVSERGREICEQLRLQPVRDVGLILRSWSVPQESLQVHRLMAIESFRGRLRFVGRKLWPTDIYIVGRNPAATSAGALLRARVRRMIGLPVKGGVAIWNWNRARNFERRFRASPASASRSEDGNVGAVGVAGADRGTRGAVLIVGPDGSGKSTVSDALARLAASRGVRIGRAHHRPGLVFGGGEGRQVKDPHAKPPRSLLLSLAKLAVVFADYAVGGRSRWEPQRAAGVLVVERGWPDMAVDPRRYRLASRALPAVRAAARVLPQPDLVAVLTGEPVELHRRKPEIGVAEVARQLDTWRDVASWAGRRVLEVDTVETEPDVVAERILDALAEPVQLDGRWRRVGLTPSRLDMRAAGKARPALAVYQPQSRQAQLGVVAARRLAGRFGAAVDEPVAGLHDLWEQLGLQPDGVVAMTSSTAGRHIVGTCRNGRLDAVVKIGRADDQRLRHEAVMLAAPISPGAHLRRPDVIWAGEWRSRFVLVTRAVPRSRNESWSVDEVVSVIDSLYRAGLDGTPITHGDLAPWNLLRTATGPVLLDWESARWADEPLHDLAHFVVSEGALLRRHTPAKALALLCAPESPGARLVNRRGYSLSDSRTLLVNYLSTSTSCDPRTVRFTSEMLELVNS